MYCQFCGKPVGEDFSFCPSCGRRLPNKEHDEQGIRDRVRCNETPLSREKMPIWQRLLGGRRPSIGISLLMIIAGLIICGIGYAFIGDSTIQQWSSMRDSEYAKVYGHVGMTSGQWIVAIVGAITNILGIVMAYIGIVALLDRVRPANRQNSVAAKIVAIVLCVAVFVAATFILTLLDIKGPMSIWDFLILCAIWRAIWVGIVGHKTPKVPTSHAGIAQLEPRSGSGKKGLIGLCVCLVVLVVVITGWGISVYRTKQATRQFLAAYEAERYDVVARLIKRVDTSNIRVQFALGMMYGNGLGVMSNDVKSVTWLRRAAEQGYADAQYNLGVMYANGSGVAKDEAEAVKWYRKAAEQGYSPAQYNLGACYETGHGVAQDKVEAVRWFRKTAEQGNDTAQYVLGLYYFTGVDGVAQDYVEAVRWFRKAAEQGNADAQYFLGGMYDDGRGVAKDEVEAVKWYRKAAGRGHAEAQFNLGWMYDNGRGVIKDEVEAAKWYRKAAEMGHAKAQLKLGTMYERGLGVSKDVREALKWYRNAAEQGEAIAQGRLGLSFENGEWGVKDEAEAVKWYRKAAEQGNDVAQHCLGVMYDNGKGVVKDEVEAVKWYRKAAEQGYASAQYNLGVCYANGEGVAKDAVEAVKWYRKAADQGVAKAQYNLGVCYQDGDGVAKDACEAVKWYLKAADQGDARAQYNLGVCYQDGEGVAKDAAEAVKWYRKAAEQGHKKAQEKLERLERIANGKPQHGDTKTLTLPGGAAMELIYVSPGSFMMGSNTGLDNEKPVHKVTLTKGFWMGKYEVTQAQWKSVMGNNPSQFKGDNRPVDCVSWYDCQKFISKVNEQLGVDSVRLPTEAEWEYVCRAGTKGDFGGRKLDDIGWYNNGSNDSGTHVVGVKHANDWGFYDMHGNVREWCNDWYGDYPTGAVINPVGSVPAGRVMVVKPLLSRSATSP